MTDDIRALLEELREIDIETWKDVRFHLINIFSVNDLGDINLRSPLLQNAYSDIIQGCIQRACASNEWALQQFQYMNQSKTCNASIFPMSGGFFEADAATPAAAILAAYVQAKRAMR